MFTVWSLRGCASAHFRIETCGGGHNHNESLGRTERNLHVMRRAISAACLASALVLTGAGSAFAAVNVGPGNGNPDTNPTGKCAPGQNQETSPGGLKKCP